MSRSSGIDILRAVFALWVMFAHVIPWASYYQPESEVPDIVERSADTLTWLFQAGGETHPAVLGFIVLSGYCIHRTGFAKNLGLPAYVIRRSLRILPVYFLAIAAGIAAWLYSTALLADPSRPVAGTAGIAAECIIAKAAAAPTVYPPLHLCAFLGNAPLNTVMAEIALYAAYPLLWLLARRLGGPVLLWLVIGGIWIGGVALISLQPGLIHWWSSASLPGFLLYWWIGAAALSPGFGRVLDWGWPGFVAAWLGLTYALLVAGIDITVLEELRKVAFALAIAWLIRRLDRPARFRGPLARVGEAGYSIYAFHAPIIYTLLVLGVAWWAAAGVAIGVGIFSFLIIEKPLIRIGAILTRNRAPPAAAEP
jgi:peptidoglycan/LPS O-acetylase OafA/YrhL